MQAILPTPNPSRSRPAGAPALRFAPVIHLASGDQVGMIAELAGRPDDQVRFGPEGPAWSDHCPADWLAGQLETAVCAANAVGDYSRPIHLPLPLPSLLHPASGPACEAAARRVRTCPQEICFEVDDGLISSDDRTAIDALHGLFKRGFRLGLDSRRTWQAAVNPAIALMLTAIRIDADELADCPALAAMAERTAAWGVSIIAEQAHWRDSERLSACGIDYAVSPRADS